MTLVLWAFHNNRNKWKINSDVKFYYKIKYKLPSYQRYTKYIRLIQAFENIVSSYKLSKFIDNISRSGIGFIK